MHFESNAKFSNAKIDLFWLFFYRGYQKTYVESVILIYNLPPFDEVRNLTLNDPKFVI